MNLHGPHGPLLPSSHVYKSILYVFYITVVL